MKGSKMFQLKDSTVHVENPSFSLKLTTEGKPFTTAELHRSFAKGQEYADWSENLSAVVARAIHDFLDDNDTYDVKYVGFNPSFSPSYVRDDGATRVLGVYEVNDDTGEETHLGNVLSTNASAMRDSAFYMLSEAAKAADTTADKLQLLLGELREQRHRLAVLGGDVDDLALEVTEALLRSDWDFVDDGDEYEFRRSFTPLTERISIVNAKLVDDEDGRHIAFDIAVDGTVVHSTLEWLDPDLDLVREGRHLDANSGYRDAVADGLGDWRRYEEVSTDAKCGVLGDIAEVVYDKLGAALAVLKAERNVA